LIEKAPELFAFERVSKLRRIKKFPDLFALSFVARHVVLALAGTQAQPCRCELPNRSALDAGNLCAFYGDAGHETFLVENESIRIVFQRRC
jgi:hypothetical protein